LGRYVIAFPFCCKNTRRQIISVPQTATLSHKAVIKSESSTKKSTPHKQEFISENTIIAFYDFRSSFSLPTFNFWNNSQNIKVIKS
jgi:hypothetical protein